MAEESRDDRERTEQPTQRRKDRAREEGQVARSPEVAAAAGLVVGALLLARAAGDGMGRAATESLQRSAGGLTLGPLTVGGAAAFVRETTLAIVLAWLPFAAGVGAIALAVQLAQTRGVLSWKPIEPKLSNLSPIGGLKRIFGLEAVVNLLKSLAKLAVLALATWSVLAGHQAELVSLGESGPEAAAAVLRSLALRLTLGAGLAFLGVALLDFGFQWFRHQRSLRMSREEVVHEHRETEGDPLVKARIRSIARSLARKRMMQQVPTADVVVVNPTHVAVALRYDPAEVPAPVVVAMGERRIAERIREIAERAGVPIVQNKPVARALLATARVGQAIPPALYVAVAEILAWVHRRHGLRHLAAGGRAA